MMMRFAVCIALILPFLAVSQETITVKYFGLTVHPFGDPTAQIQPYKLDDRARFVLNFGGFVGYEKFFYRDYIAAKVIQGAFSDCSGGFASITHLGARVNLMRTKKHRVYLGIGPTLLVRDSWSRFGTDYEPSGYFNETYSKRFGDLQWKFIPYGMEFEYDYAVTPADQISVSFTPGVPLACILSVGWKHWFHLKEYDPYKVYIPKKRKS